MSRALKATCSAGVVTLEGDTVAEAVILSEGQGASDGMLFLDGDEATYLTSNAADLKTALGKISDCLTKVADTLTAIGSGMTGSTTAPPGTLSTNVSAINGFVSEINTLKGSLK